MGARRGRLRSARHSGRSGLPRGQSGLRLALVRAPRRRQARFRACRGFRLRAVRRCSHFVRRSVHHLGRCPMRVKVAEATALFWDQSRLVWDDYIGHRQLALSADSERVLRWFGDWRELDSIDELGDEYLAIAERLLDAGVLIAEDSDEHAIEHRILPHWGPWVLSALYLPLPL